MIKLCLTTGEIESLANENNFFSYKDELFSNIDIFDEEERTTILSALTSGILTPSLLSTALKRNAKDTLEGKDLHFNQTTLETLKKLTKRYSDLRKKATYRLPLYFSILLLKELSTSLDKQLSFSFLKKEKYTVKTTTSNSTLEELLYLGYGKKMKKNRGRSFFSFYYEYTFVDENDIVEAQKALDIAKKDILETLKTKKQYLQNTSNRKEN